MNTYIKEKEQPQINNLNLNPKELAKKDRLSPKLAEEGNKKYLKRISKQHFISAKQTYILY